MSKNKSSQHFSSANDFFKFLADSNQRVILITDYDGTLTPFVDRPDQAILSEKHCVLLKQLRDHANIELYIITGRSYKELDKLLRQESFNASCQHGTETAIVGQEVKKLVLSSTAQQLLNENKCKALLFAKEIIKDYGLRDKNIVAVRDNDEQETDYILEEKDYSFCLHTRALSKLVTKENLQNILIRIQQFIFNLDLSSGDNSREQFKVMRGDHVFEYMRDHNKGSAVANILAQTQYNPEKDMVVFIGDDFYHQDQANQKREARGTDAYAAEEVNKCNGYVIQVQSGEICPDGHNFTPDISIANPDELFKELEQILPASTYILANRATRKRNGQYNNGGLATAFTSWIESKSLTQAEKNNIFWVSWAGDAAKEIFTEADHKILSPYFEKAIEDLSSLNKEEYDKDYRKFCNTILCEMLNSSGEPHDTQLSAIRQAILNDFAQYNITPTAFSSDDIENFYEAQCNRTIWQLCHLATYEDTSAVQGIINKVAKTRAWDYYKKINQRYVAALSATIEQNGGLKSKDRIWIHDYHLMLTPALIRQQHPSAPIGYFHHIPFPDLQRWKLLPYEQRKAIIDGLLGADNIAFHTDDYRKNFIRAAADLRYDVSNDNDKVIVKTADGERAVSVSTIPIGIDYEKYKEVASDQDIQNILEQNAKDVASDKLQSEKKLTELENFVDFLGTNTSRKVFLSVDRLDPSKGIDRKLEAILLFLRKHKNENLHQEVRFEFICVPSRRGVPEYDALFDKVKQLEQEIHKEFGDKVLQVHHKDYASYPGLVQWFYSKAQVLAVTPKKDGFNLVAEEFFAAHDEDKQCVEILSTGAGVEKHMPTDNSAIVRIDQPLDPECIAEAYYPSLQNLQDEQQLETDVNSVQEKIKELSVFEWADKNLKGMATAAATRTQIPESMRSEPFSLQSPISPPGDEPYSTSLPTPHIKNGQPQRFFAARKRPDDEETHSDDNETIYSPG